MVFASTVSVPSDSSVSLRVRDVTRAMIDELALQCSEGLLSGAYVLGAIGNEVVEARSVGCGEDGLAMSGESIFPLFSMTKLATSLLALQMVRRGEFALDDRVDEYFPQFRGQPVLRQDGSLVPTAIPMRVRHLLMHTSGIDGSGFGRKDVHRICIEKGLYDLAAYGGARSIDSNTFVGMMADIPLSFHPGTYWRYSRSHDVLGCLMSNVTGLSLPHLFANRLLDPIGLCNTGFKGERSGVTQAVENDWPFVSAGSGLVSSPDDYLKLCALLTPMATHLCEDLVPDVSLVRKKLSLDFPVGDDPIEFPGSGWGFGPGFAVKKGKSVFALGWLSREGSCFVLDTVSGAVVTVFLTAKVKSNRDYFRFLSRAFFQSFA